MTGRVTAALALYVLVLGGNPAFPIEQFQDLPDLPLGEAPEREAAELDEQLLIEPGELPDYDLLRLDIGEEMELGEAYILSLPMLEEEIVDDQVIFPEVDPAEPFARLSLPEMVEIAVENNLGLVNSRRSVRIARSQLRSAEADFIPFVDLVGSTRYDHFRDQSATRSVTVLDPEGEPRTVQQDTVRNTETITNTGGVETGVQLPTGGSLSAGSTLRRRDTHITDGGGVAGGDKTYDSNAEVRYIQPLLRGAGTDVGQANLRRTRLREMDQIINDQLSTRDVTLNVINAYFNLLQTARQLQVSRDSIRERLRFLEETQVRFDVGRVDESEILRAEILYLQELETAISRRRTLDDQKENLLILLGLPLDTPISFVDITEDLAGRGRVDIPRAQDAVEEALNARLELIRSDISLALSEIDLRVARNDVLPQLNLDAGYARGETSGSYTSAMGFENEGWDAGLSVRVPLVNIQRREAARRSLLGLEQDQTSRLATERNLIQDVLSTHRSVQSTEAQLTILRKSVEQARRSLELINGRFEVGFASVTEVRLAQDDLFAAETRYSNALLNYQIQLARLYVAMGRPLI